MSRRTQGIALLITAVAILAIPGAVVNSLQGEGMISKTQTMTCANGICTLNTANPCNQAVTPSSPNGPCSLNNQIQILNPCSPWSNLFTLNLPGFVGSFFNNCGQAVTQSVPLNLPLPASVNQTSGGTQITYKISGCTVLAASNIFGKISFNLGCSSLTPALKLANGTSLVGFFGYRVLVNINVNSASCTGGDWNQVIGNASAGTSPTSAVMCITQYIVPTGCVTTNCINAVILTVNGLVYGDSPYSVTGFDPTVQPYNPAVVPAQPIKVVNFTNPVPVAAYIHLQGPGLNTQPIQNGVPGTGFTGINTSNLIGFLLGLIGAALLLFIGLGIGGQTQGLTFGAGFWSNPQGSKLAQTLGIGLLIWFPLYTEFHSWFSNGYLPAGLDGDILSGVTPGTNGNYDIISILLVITMFVSLYFISQSGSGGAAE